MHNKTYTQLKMIRYEIGYYQPNCNNIISIYYSTSSIFSCILWVFRWFSLSLFVGRWFRMWNFWVYYFFWITVSIKSFNHYYVFCVFSIYFGCFQYNLCVFNLFYVFLIYFVCFQFILCVFSLLFVFSIHFVCFQFI